MLMQVKIYTTSTCTYCKAAKEFFKKNGIKYEEVDVGKNPIAIAEMIAKSKQMGTPVIEINRNIIIGFDRPVLEKLLKIKK